ncbi:antibiotic biosynthesis monooxygenase [Aeromicrobium sp. YIM 150415]|uniref:putative quinol monooxygenase n=1 Tax=Aeromicrobium sp. YIM 150415 TaxID=2803912 RepID=UPI0019638736|nr:antibiotic biosynthesis monooxygenase family protein [Aeromicrobium sp. YIM 150415]MBM9465369.1 antibiotic biosynthesis monooxygenase [Aeromicrobium sp. YIM 150415]
MIIIAGHEIVAADRRDTFVDAFRGMVARARDADGCLHASITADSVDPERVDVLEIWRDEKALKAWRKRARGPRVEQPEHVEIRRYEATEGGPLF